MSMGLRDQQKKGTLFGTLFGTLIWDLFGQKSPGSVAFHASFSIQLCAKLPRSGEEVGDGLACLSKVSHSQLGAMWRSRVYRMSR